MREDIFKTHQITIDKQSLAKLPCAEFPCEAIVVDRTEDVDSAIDYLEKSAIIGFDTETKPSFRKGVTHNVSLIQLSTHDRCYLFRINMTGMHPRLTALLENPHRLKVGLSLHDDFHNLRKLADIQPEGFIDLQKFVKDFHIADNSLTRIHAILFDERISKGQRLTNWEAAELTPTQVTYAALDAYSCIRIYDYLMGGAFVPKESKYLSLIPVEEESE